MLQVLGILHTQFLNLKHSHADNHYLDCEVYAMAAAEMLGVRSLHLESRASEESRERTEQYAPEEEWIRQNESWL